MADDQHTEHDPDEKREWVTPTLKEIDVARDTKGGMTILAIEGPGYRPS